MTAEDYRKKAQLFAELMVICIKEGDFSKFDDYMYGVKQAIEDMRKKNRGE
jgi:hypothetical protein